MISDFFSIIDCSYRAFGTVRLEARPRNTPGSTIGSIVIESVGHYFQLSKWATLGHLHQAVHKVLVWIEFELGQHVLECVVAGGMLRAPTD